MKQFDDGVAIDFYTNKPIPINQISIDHVIPWSYMYSDDIWNLVLTSKSNNSKKSNAIPNKGMIRKLISRNAILVNKLNGKNKKILLEANNNNYVWHFFHQLIAQI